MVKDIKKNNLDKIGQKIGPLDFLNDDEAAVDINEQKNKSSEAPKKKRSYMLTQECISMLLKMKADLPRYQDEDLSVIVEEAIREKYEREMR